MFSFRSREIALRREVHPFRKVHSGRPARCPLVVVLEQAAEGRVIEQLIWRLHHELLLRVGLLCAADRGFR